MLSLLRSGVCCLTAPHKQSLIFPYSEVPFRYDICMFAFIAVSRLCSEKCHEQRIFRGRSQVEKQELVAGWEREY